MGSIPYDGGVTFRVWAPHADAVFVVGTFNDWSPTATTLSAEAAGGLWSADVPAASVGDAYRYRVVNNAQPVPDPATRRDPRARAVSSSSLTLGNTLVHDPDAFDWAGDNFQPPPIEDLVIYEMNVRTFNRSTASNPGTFASAIERLDHLVDLGVTAVEVMPVTEFAEGTAPLRGYNSPYGVTDPFAVEGILGGPDGYKAFVKACHARGLAVWQDVVYSHWGPWDTHLRKYDGWWTEDYTGGIYFYDRKRVESGWGPRPDYSRPEVRQYIKDNVAMWITDYHVDGFRWDAIESIFQNGPDKELLPNGWSLLQESNDLIRRDFPHVISTAEDIWTGSSITLSTSKGGAGFHSQWHGFNAALRAAATQKTDTLRDMYAVRAAVRSIYNGEPYQRIIFTESHNEARRSGRLAAEIDPEAPDSWRARKLSTLAAAVLFTSPGIPLLFQGLEFLEPGPMRYDKGLDWDRAATHAGVVRLYSDLIRLRRNIDGLTSGLRGKHLDFFHTNNAHRIIAYHRWDEGGGADDVVVIANFSSRAWGDYTVGFPRPGLWHVRLDTDSTRYGADYGGAGASHVVADGAPLDGMAHSASVSVGPYSALILSQSTKTADRPHERVAARPL
jgi:1,4-alpha-glucan branching enzyme